MSSNTILKIEKLTVGQLQTNSYLLYSTQSRKALIIDPGDDADYIMRKIADLGLEPCAIIATHGHFDHILAAKELQMAFDLPFTIHEADTFLVNRMSETAYFFLKYQIVETPPEITSHLDSTKITIEDIELTVIPSPGHTPGSVSLYSQTGGFVLSGDTLFAEGGVGRTDFAYSSAADLGASVDRLLQLPNETIMYPGHGDSSTILGEKEVHIYLKKGVKNELAN